MKFNNNKILAGKLLKLNTKNYGGSFYYEFYQSYDDAINYCDIHYIKTDDNSIILALDEYIIDKIEDLYEDRSKYYFIIKILFQAKIFYMRTTALTDRFNKNDIYYINNGNFDVVR